jgi:peptide/nickel transport system substrate-binding protein
VTTDITRRQLLDRGGRILAGSSVLGASALLTGCGGSTSTPSPSSAAGSTPVRGGTLTAGMITGGSTETLNPGIAVTYTDIVRLYSLYDFLFTTGPDVRSLVPGLALSAESNRDASVWTLTLRPGVTWHDGKPFGGDDVVWTLQGWSKSTNYANGFVAGLIDFPQVRTRGPMTVEIPLTAPTAQFPTILPFYNMPMVQNGSTAASFTTRPIGTGPFKFESFTPGSQSVFTANRDYWQHGGPYVDRFVVNSTFANETTRLNALLSGAIHLSPLFPFNFARQQKAAGQVNVFQTPGTGAIDFSMRVDKEPFTDVRVRQAMKLLVDRQALIDGAISGFGVVGDDLWGLYAEYYATSLRAMYDPEKAKSLLKAAGQENLTVTLPTSPVSPGFVESATLLAEQAAAVGVKIKLQLLSPSVYYTSAGGYLTRAFGQDDTDTAPSLTEAWRQWYTRSAPYGETHWANQPGGGDQTLIQAAMAATDPARAEQLWYQAQVQQFEQGGSLVWTYPDWIDAASKTVQGMKTSKSGPVNNYRVLDLWLA